MLILVGPSAPIGQAHKTTVAQSKNPPLIWIRMAHLKHLSKSGHFNSLVWPDTLCLPAVDATACIASGPQHMAFWNKTCQDVVYIVVYYMPILVQIPIHPQVPMPVSPSCVSGISTRHFRNCLSFDELWIFRVGPAAFKIQTGRKIRNPRIPTMMQACSFFSNLFSEFCFSTPDFSSTILL